MTPIDLSQVRLRSGREEEEEDEDVNEDPEHDGADEDEQMDQEMDEYDDYDDYDDRDESDLDPDERYITLLYIDICGPDKEAIGTMRLHVIARKELVQAGENFVGVLDEHSGESASPNDLYDRELSEFADRLFSHKGKIARGVVSEGRNVWGRELNRDATVAYLEAICIDKAYRCQGVGAWAINQVLRDNHLYLDDAQYLYAMPCALWSDYPELDRSNCKGTPEELKAASARVVRFFRKVGFRRLGTSEYFCCARSLSHPSRALPPDQDADEVTLPDLLAGLNPTARQAVTISQRQNLDFP
ncbi:hypothetical protein JCM8202v2_000378 [Rhodotorula sphaerocarpa]